MDAGAGLRLGRDLGADAQVVLSRKETADPGLHRTAVTNELLQQETMSGAIKIAGTVGPITSPQMSVTRSCTSAPASTHQPTADPHG